MDIFEEYARFVGQDKVNILKEEGRFIGNMMLKIKDLNLRLKQANDRIEELESEITTLKNVNNSI